MVTETCTAHVVRQAAEVALRMRQPARRAAGSVYAAAIVCAMFVGIYNIVVGTIYFSESYHFYFGMEGLMTTAGGLAFIAAFADFILIFGALRRKEEYLHSIVCAALAVYMLCGLMPVCVLIGLAYNMRWIFMLWEVPRLLVYPVHVCVMYCVLAEVRGGDAAQGLDPAQPIGGGGGGGGDGWLKNNLARAGHGPLQAAGGGGGDGVLLKAQANTPAHIASVHIGAPPTPAHASGPLSSSEA